MGVRKDLLRAQIKELYLGGKSYRDIGALLNLAHDSVRYHKNEAKKAGDDWDALLLAKKRDTKDLEIKEQEFLALLISSFEESLEELKKSDAQPSVKLEMLNKYVTSYYKLKAPKDMDCTSQVIDAITKTIYAVSDLALADDNKPVIEFLSSNSEKITEIALKSKKRS